MLDYKFEKKLKEFIVENKPEGSLDIHISCDINGNIKITENYREKMEEELRDVAEELQDIIDDLKDDINDLKKELKYGKGL